MKSKFWEEYPNLKKTTLFYIRLESTRTEIVRKLQKIGPEGISAKQYDGYVDALCREIWAEKLRKVKPREATGKYR